MKTETKIKLSGGDRTFVCINSAFLILFFCITLYPMLFVLSASFSDPTAVSTGKMYLLPINPSTAAYAYILKYQEIWSGYLNTAFYTAAGTLLNLAVTLPCAYALSRPDMPDRKIIMTLFIVTMYFSGGLIPGYLNVQSLGLLDTRAIMLLDGLVSAFNLIVARTFFASTIPWELHEAAFLDGCSDFRMFVKIILPLSAPIIVVMILYYGVGHWNTYFNAMVYLKTRAKYPLQLFLREILTQSMFASNMLASGDVFSDEQLVEMSKQAETANMIKYAVIVVSTVPMLIFYPFVQKYFAKGVMIGAVKG
jgi:putative aldouronate transport system permease protein